MSVSFDWDFKEESDASRRPGGSPPGRRRRRLIQAIIVVIVLLPIVLLLRAWLVGRLESVKRDEEKLRAVIDLELKTVASGDPELFRTLQDPIDPTWQERQVDRYFSPSAPDFVPAPGLVPSERTPEINKIHFFGHSARAEMTHWFETVPRGTGEATGPSDRGPAPYAFQVTWFYREDEEGNWHHVEPPGDYWGIPYSWHGSRLEVRSTEIEAQRIDATARELAIMISQACLWIGCPEDAGYTLSFEDILAPEVRGDTWALPALYLTGLPDDEETFVVWERAVKSWAIEMLARAQVGDEEPTRRVIYGQLVSQLQADLGLKEEPGSELVAAEVAVLAEALRAQEQHPLWSLWQVKADPDDPERARLLEVEATALLFYIKDQAEYGRLFELLPALGDYARLSEVLVEVYGIDRVEFSSGWLDYLSNVTGVAVVPQPIFTDVPLPVGPLEPPSLPTPPDMLMGDQIALNCGGRIWVGNADGSDLVALTERRENFDAIFWSPDGHWLLTSWQPSRRSATRALYLLASDGVEGRLLTTDPALFAWPLGWSPDGRTAVFYTARLDAVGQEMLPHINAVDIETGATRELSGLPFLSPDGEMLVYQTISGDWPTGSVWLADADWENVRLIEPHAWIWPGEIWAPDGSKLALALTDEALDENGASVSAVAIYDVATELRVSTITATELKRAIVSSAGEFVTDGSDHTGLAETRLPQLMVLGWSADGRHVLVWAQEAGMSSYATGPVVLAAITPGAEEDAPAARLLAYGERKYVDAAWSPTDGNRLLLTWRPGNGQAEGLDAYILDLDAGAVYTATETLNASWSPDGEWAAFSGESGVTITDEDGQPRFHFVVDVDVCYQVAWSPAADLNGLDETAR